MEALSGPFVNFSEVCREFCISRKTGYETVRRYTESGRQGLLAQSRAPHHHPNRVSDEVRDRLLELRRARPDWGPKKQLVLLAQAAPDLELPSESFVCELYKRHGLVRSRRRRARPACYESPEMGYAGPNALWCADFKGDMDLGRCRRPAPLTVSDGTSRYLLALEDLRRKRHIDVKPVFQRLFREYGLPDAIRCDNGPPFASVGLCGLCALNVWWIKLRILPVRGRPGCPQDNGRHERIHATMEREIHADTKVDSQTLFDVFQNDYNQLRPHESLAMKTPSDVYTKSTKPYTKPRDPEYVGMDFLERLDKRGRLSWKGKHHPLAKVLGKELVGIKRVDTDEVSIHFGPVKLGTIKRGKFKPNQAKTKKPKSTNG